MDNQRMAGAPETVSAELWKILGEHRAEFVEQAARMIADRVCEVLRNAVNGGFVIPCGEAKPETCNLAGLRRRQFARFCEIMRERPTEAPFRAAKAALAELPGRGGYTRPSSLQRYAGKHRKCW